MDRHFRDSRVVDFLLSVGAEAAEFLGDKEKMQALAAKIDEFGYTAEISTDEEHSVQKLLYRQGSQSPRSDRLSAAVQPRISSGCLRCTNPSAKWISRHS